MTTSCKFDFSENKKKIQNHLSRKHDPRKTFYIKKGQSDEVKQPTTANTKIQLNNKNEKITKKQRWNGFLRRQRHETWEKN